MLSDLEIAAVFDATFAEHNTRLLGGANAPYYQPPVSPGEPARVFYTLDYPASALHEAAHWLRAGAARRQLVDYGYWYVDEPRPAPVQRAFLAVEAAVQALECVLSREAGRGFRVSVDDFEMAAADIDAFERTVRARAGQIDSHGLPPRAAAFAKSLRAAAEGKAA